MSNKSISYIDENNINIIEDITSRKEFLLFKKSVDAIKKIEQMNAYNTTNNIIQKFQIKDINLEFKSYQMLVCNFINPNTPYSRLLLNWQTGSGKTIGALAIAMNFINIYKNISNNIGDSRDSSIGSIIIIGFTQNIFIDELLKHPEFGFISRAELITLNNLKKKAHSGGTNDIEQLNKYYSSLKRRIFNRNEGGYFKFIGYKELTNRLLFHNRENIRTRNKELAEEDYITKLTTLSYEELKKQIDDDAININKELLKEFENSLVICDEIHNTYNTLEKNNWGLSLQLILNYVSSARALFLSATPLNNSATEIIDLLNLLLPRKYYDNLNKDDYFTKVGEIVKFKLNQKQKIINYLRGRVSFILNKNDKFMATKSFKGESIKGIDFLKFIRCPMSTFQYNTYKHAINELKAFAIDLQHINDIVLPSPKSDNPYSDIGIYNSKDIANYLTEVPTKWKDKYGIYYSTTNNIVTGQILEAKNLGKVSTKYYTMINILLQNIKNKKGKTFIFHNYIHNTGTFLIYEILLSNGIIGEYDISNNNTICAICSIRKKDHSEAQLNPLMIDTENTKVDHFYQPARMIIIHGELDKQTISRSLERFNNINNADGSKIMFLVGSRIIKEAHTINSVRNIFVMSRPDNISSLIQIIGRAIRLNSHRLLPPNQRHVNIYTFVASLPKKSERSYEEQKYFEKIEDFKEIQLLEKIIHENSIDSYFNYDLIWNNLVDEQNEEDGDINDTEIQDSNLSTTLTKYNKKQTVQTFGLDILPYNKPVINVKDIRLDTFNAYFAYKEVEYCAYIIKRLFVEISSVFTYKDLYKAVRQPPFHVEINTEIISGDIFNISLTKILYNLPSSNYINIDDENILGTVEYNLLDKLHNIDDKIIITQNNIRYVITKIGDLYTLVPLDKNNLFVDTEIIFRENLGEYKDMKYMDIAQYLKIDIDADYQNKKYQFINKWKFTNLTDLGDSINDFSIKFHIKFIEDVISYMFNIWTQPDKKKAENHTFYVKMLYFYDLKKFVAWAHLVDKTLEERYSKYVNPVVLELYDKNMSKEIKDIKKLQNSNNKDYKKVSDNNSSDSNILISIINRNNKEWVSSGIIKEYEHSVDMSEKLFNNVYKKSKNVARVNANLLPVGHYLDKIPKFYDHPDGWFEYIIPNQIKNVKENNVIVGFDTRSKTSFNIKFKLRTPIHLQKSKKNVDSRYIEYGTVCTTKSKYYLANIAKKLDINIDGNESTSDLCTNIRNRLIYLELKERNKVDSVKYFYSVLESPNFE